MAGWLISTILAASSSAAMQPVGPWQVEYAEGMCIMTHDFARDKAHVTLGFRPWPQGNDTEIALIWQQKGVLIVDGKAKILFDTQKAALTTGYTAVTIPKGRLRVATFTVQKGALSGIYDAKNLSIALVGGRSFEFSLPSTKKSLPALEACNADLLKSWGLDPTEPTHLSQGPKGDPATFIEPGDYPAAAVRSNQQGRVVAIATVAADGHVSDCSVAASSGSTMLDVKTCEVIKQRGHFQPALDLDGKPAVAHTVIPVRWVIQKDLGL